MVVTDFLMYVFYRIQQTQGALGIKAKHRQNAHMVVAFPLVLLFSGCCLLLMRILHLRLPKQSVSGFLAGYFIIVGIAPLVWLSWYYNEKRINQAVERFRHLELSGWVAWLLFLGLMALSYITFYVGVTYGIAKT